MPTAKKSTAKKPARTRRGAATAYAHPTTDTKPDSSKLREDAVNHLLDEIMNAKDLAKQAENMKAWLALSANQYAYSWHNLALIFSQKRGAKFVASHSRWQKIFRQAGNNKAYIKKGSGIKVIVPMSKKVPDPKDPDNTRNIRFFGVGNVFDVSDVVDFDLAEWEQTVNPVTEDHTELFQWAVNRFSQLPYVNSITVTKVKAGCGGYAKLHHTHTEDGKTTYVSDIVISDKANDADKLRVLFHELAHASQHIGRGLNATDKKHHTSMIELEAESVAYIVSRRQGLNSDDSVFYVASWEGNRTTAAESLKRIADTARELLTILAEKTAVVEVEEAPVEPVKKPVAKQKSVARVKAKPKAKAPVKVAASKRVTKSSK